METRAYHCANDSTQSRPKAKDLLSNGNSPRCSDFGDMALAKLIVLVARSNETHANIANGNILIL